MGTMATSALHRSVIVSLASARDAGSVTTAPRIAATRTLFSRILIPLSPCVRSYSVFDLKLKAPRDLAERHKGCAVQLIGREKLSWDRRQTKCVIIEHI